MLNEKQKRFCEEYLVDMNGTQSAIRAGYSAKTAYSIADELLRKPEIKEYVAKLRHEQRERVQVNADYVLRRLVEIDNMDVADILSESGALRPITDWPKVWRQFISAYEVSELIAAGDDKPIASVLKKIKWPDKVKNLELIGKHVSVSAFSENLRHNLFTDANGKPVTGINITVTAVSPEGKQD